MIPGQRYVGLTQTRSISSQPSPCPVDQYHGHDDGGEHHLQDGLIIEVELRGQLAGVAEPGALQQEAEAEADATLTRLLPA